MPSNYTIHSMSLPVHNVVDDFRENYRTLEEELESIDNFDLDRIDERLRTLGIDPEVRFFSSTSI